MKKIQFDLVEKKKVITTKSNKTCGSTFKNISENKKSLDAN